MIFGMDEVRRELFQAIILSHSKHPHHKGELSSCTHKAQGSNPHCGDQVVVYLNIDKQVIREVRFNGSGCAISQASASMMTDLVQGKTLDEAYALCQRVYSLLKGIEAPVETLGDFGALAGVREYPQRIFCAELAWKLLEQALAQE